MNPPKAPIAPIRFDDWPPGVRAAWEGATAKGDILDPGGPASLWRPATLKYVIHGIEAWLGFLAELNSINQDHDITHRCTREMVAKYAERLFRTCAPVTVRQTILALERAIFVLAPDFDRRFIRALLNRIPYKPIRRKPIVDIDDLWRLGLRLMAEASSNPSAPVSRAAIKYRDGLIIALLSCRPIRSRNLVGLEIGRTFLQTKTGWRIELPAEEVKTHRSLGFDVPDALSTHIETYISDYRPYLLRRTNHGTSGGPFWGSYLGRQAHAQTIASAICSRTKAALGVQVNLHHFRECAATTTAFAAPDHVRILPAVLGHSDYKTTQKHYIASQTNKAADLYQSVISELGKEG